MEFLKELFQEPLSYDAFEKAVEEKGFKLADISKGEYVVKDKFDKANKALKDATETISNLTGEMQTLKDNNASVEDWQSRFEALDKDIKEKEAVAKAEREKAEREADITNRYNAVCVDKDGKPLEFIHEAVKNEYLRKFGEALSNIDSTEFKGKSDADIFHTLTKDDATAFKGTTAQVTLKGGGLIGGGGITKEDFAKMGYADKAKLYNENPKQYEELKGEI